MKTEMKPAKVSQLSLANLRIEAQAATRIAETNPNQTVHAPWELKVLKAIVTPRMPEPVHKTSSSKRC